MYGGNTSRTHFFSSPNMDMSDLLHDPAALPPGKGFVEGALGKLVAKNLNVQMPEIESRYSSP